MAMMQQLVLIASATLAMPLAGTGQSFDTSLPRLPGGARIEGLSVFSGYSTSAILPTGGVQPPPNGLGALGDDINYGANARFSLRRFRPHTNFSLQYSLTYGGSANYSGLNALNQSLSFTAIRSFGPKWTATLSGSGQDNTQAQFLFEPGALSTIAQSATNFEDLAAAFSIGQFSNGEMAAMLTGAPVLDTPTRNLLLGDRVLSYSIQASLDYAYSSRLRFHLSSVSAAGQHRSGENSTAAQAAVMPRSLGIDAGVGFSYSLSPRTDFGVSGEENRVQNPYQLTYISTVKANFGRKMGMHWFLGLDGGGSFTDVRQTTFSTPKTRQLVGGGSIGFRTYSNVILASYNRAASDTYGFAVGTDIVLSGVWTWHRPGSRWDFTGGCNRHETRNTGFVSLTGWDVSASVSERLGSGTSLSAQYVYFKSTGSYRGPLDHSDIHSVRLSFGWEPSPLIR